MGNGPRYDDIGRPLPASTWGGIGLPACGTYRVRLVRGGPWLPARVAYEQTTDPEGRLCDRWAPVLRIMSWVWYRTEIIAWQGSLHPIAQADFDVLCSLPLDGDPMQPLHEGISR